MVSTVKCADNPARDPYEAHRVMDIQSAPIESGYRVYELGVVPAGKRLAIQYLSANMPIGSALTAADLEKTVARLSHDHAQYGEPTFNLDLPFTRVLNMANGNTQLLLSQPITFYAPPGAKARLLVLPHPNARAVEVYATGHYVQL